jgi:hypothetical protein
MFSALMIGRVPPAAGAEVLPSEIKAWLDQNFPGWRLTPIITEQAREGQRRNGNDFDRSFVWGDFDGDGKRDYVVGFSHQLHTGQFPGEYQLVFAFLRRAAGYEPRQLESAKAPDLKPDLDIAKKRSVFMEYRTNKKITCSNDCIRIVPAAGPRALFRYENTDLKMYYTSD